MGSQLARPSVGLGASRTLGFWAGGSLGLGLGFSLAGYLGSGFTGVNQEDLQLYRHLLPTVPQEVLPASKYRDNAIKEITG
jgi:hypothetical protein